MTCEKLCVFCNHWRFDGGERGYSDLTPGDDASIDCRKGHYRGIRIHDLGSEADFRELIKRAQACQDYDQYVPK